jgi:hypothetical protein
MRGVFETEFCLEFSSDIIFESHRTVKPVEDGESEMLLRAVQMVFLEEGYEE